MSYKITREAAQKVLDAMPETLDLMDFAQKLRRAADVLAGIEQANAGMLVPHEEALRQIKSRVALVK